MNTQILTEKFETALVYARSLLADWRQHGDTIWNQFNGGKEKTLWFYKSLVDVYQKTGSDSMTEEFTRVVSELGAESSKSC